MLGSRIRSFVEVCALRRPFAGAIVVAAALLGAACAHGRAVTAQAPPQLAPVSPPEDRVARLIADADKHLHAGIAELEQGHLNRAREDFDKSVEIYLTAPGGAYADAQLGAAYRRTLDTINLRELEALAAGDGFTETQPEPASIDEVGDIAMSEAAPSEDTRRTAEEALQEEVNDLPILLNDAVLTSIDVYQNRLRDWFSEALARGGRYLPRIREIFAEEEIPTDLAYVALVESAFKPSALSRAKAKGVWQFIAETGKRYGLQQDWWVDERSDPEKATRAAAKYLKGLYGMFGDWNLALAGYNAGEALVARAIARYGTNDFWELSRTRAFRQETKNYVPLIHAAIIVAKAPEKYGFDVSAEPELRSERVSVQGAVDLRVLSECADTSLEQLRLLNPELRRLATPAGRAYDLRVPVGTGSSLIECLASVPAEKRVQFRTHVVARGQSLYSIARRYGLRSTDIAAANGLSSRQALSVGSELIIPIEPRASAAPAASRASLSEAASRRTIRIQYRIKPGDTLGAIAAQHGTTVRELQSWNRLRGTRIVAGDVITIYTARKF